MWTAARVEFSKPLHDVEVREKESARFECEVSREDAKVRKALFLLFVHENLNPVLLSELIIFFLLSPQITWLKDGTEIRKGKKYEIIAQGRQHILLIHKATFDDEAEYECDAQTSKSSGMLTVVGKKRKTKIRFSPVGKKIGDHKKSTDIRVETVLMFLI